MSFTPAEKLEIARLLINRVKVDRLEIGSARVSEGEREAVGTILRWAEHHGCLESMGDSRLRGRRPFGRVDRRQTGGRVINLLAKGSEEHCRVQLRKTPARHFDEVAAEIEGAHNRGLLVNLYLEDWSNGMRNSFAYVYEFLNRLQGLPVERIMLPDTLGILDPEETATYFEWIYRSFPHLRLDFHGHNDYGGGDGEQSGRGPRRSERDSHHDQRLGERTGNQPLAQLAVTVHDMTSRRTRIVEKELQHASEIVQNISGKRCAWNMPVVGADVFTQTCGVHADGDKKGNLYANRPAAGAVRPSPQLRRWASSAARRRSIRIWRRWGWSFLPRCAQKVLAGDGDPPRGPQEERPLRAICRSSSPAC